MKIMTEIQSVWKSLTKSAQRKLNSDSMNYPDAGWRMRCKLIRNLVRGKSPETISDILGCGRSQVYRIKDRFVAESLGGLVDHREDNGQTKADET